MTRQKKELERKIDRAANTCDCCDAFGYQPSCENCPNHYKEDDLRDELARLRGFECWSDELDFYGRLWYVLGEFPFDESFGGKKWDAKINRKKEAC